jgi:hypothetical protein
MGYSLSELEEVQSKWGLRFPPDLIELLREHRPLIGGRGSFDWLLSEPSVIQDRLDWPFELFWFDVEKNESWWPEWGEKPAGVTGQRDRLKEIFNSAPKLIPLFGHRYIPAEPFEIGNPVLSVYQMDVICYGTDLDDWLRREQHGWASRPWGNIKEITFWSEVLRKNSAEPD